MSEFDTGIVRDEPDLIDENDKLREQLANVRLREINKDLLEANVKLREVNKALLEACKAAEIYLENSGFVSRSDPTCDCKTCQLFRTLRAAMALAEGRR